MEKTKVQEVREQIDKMLTERSGELERILEKQNEAREQLEKARKAEAEATAETNLDAYEAAKRDTQKAKTALDMYSARYAQLKTLDFISEEESDNVIESLLKYEAELEQGLKDAMAEPLKLLADLLNTYRQEVRETETVIKAWESNIHANHRNRTARYADGSNRSAEPVPVHMTVYRGCQEAGDLEKYLEKARGLYE